ncbi:MAG: hypothetical protein KIT33_06225 [Candidatus Kapabacteria bacterium]|nr:hypothetical protein [Ignavibacteriota bacterium]MCW5884553.1 hypothetical protein [Candidatus Kapabacteria bacterium]
MKIVKSLLFSIIILNTGILFSQKDEVNKNLRLVAYGRIDEVRAVIPDLLAKYPDDPGVKLLHGTILEDAFLALDVYKGIIQKYPESAWADHAYWRIIQFYAVLGDTIKSQAELANFRGRYPASPFIGPASDVVRSAVALSRKNMKTVSATSERNQNNLQKIHPENMNKPATSSKPDVINPDEIAATIDLKDNVKKLPENSKSDNSNISKFEKSMTDTGTKKSDITETPVKPKTNPNLNGNQSVTKIEEIPNLNTSHDSPKEPEFFGLQVGIYKDSNTAESEKNKFLVRRLRTQVVEKEVNGIVMHAVVIGHYSSLESAEEGKKIVSIQCNCEPIIYRK